MSRRRLVPLALVVTLLLAVVAIVARGRPLGSGSGSGGGLSAPASFWDYAFTTFVIIVGLWFVLGVAAALLHLGGPRREAQSFQGRTAMLIAVLIAIAALRTLIGGHLDLNRLLHRHDRPSRVHTGPLPRGKTRTQPATSRPVRFRWDELAIVLGLVLGLGVLAAGARSRLGAAAESRRAPEVLAAALDESLDDLRADPDIRRAIVAAYARMEKALAAAGIPRHPAEAPLEYVERALLSLDTSAAAVRRLTDLFEWARFSHHEPEPSMRDDAVDALVAVRDELRASELALA